MEATVDVTEGVDFYEFSWHIRTSGLLDVCQQKEWIEYINNQNISYDDKRKRLSFFYDE